MTIFIFALHGVATGGPEATHQLSDALLEQGFDAKLIYFKWDDLKAGLLEEMPEYGPFAPEYERYKVSLARQAIDEEGHVIVLPETLAHAVPFFQHAKVLVWWLSVDNAFGALSAVNLNYLRRPNVYHASQSRYAEAFTQALQLNSLGMLSDYTVDLTEYATPLPMSERPKLVAFNARANKVIADLPAIAEAIANIDPEIKLVALANASRAEIAAIFATARVYVDLGSFPGKDRMPREAASMGCWPLSMRAGGGEEMVCGSKTVMHATTDDIARMVASDTSSVATEGSRSLTHRLIRQVHDERITFNTEVSNVFSQLV